MRIGPNWWISDFKGYKEIKSAYDNGSRLASVLTFSHVCKDGDKEYFCFRPDNRMVDGRIYVTGYMLCDVFNLLKPTVSVDFEGNKFMFTPDKLTVNDSKTYKYKRDSEFVYKLQKTQYKGESGYGLLTHLVDPFGRNVIEHQLKNAKYID